MWSASLTSVATEAQSSLFGITLSFTNGTETQARTLHKLSYSAEEIAVYAQAVIVELEGRDAAIAQVQAAIKNSPAIQLPRDGFLTPTFDALTSARAQSQKINDLAAKLSQLNVLQSAATAGLIPADDADLKAAQNAVASLAPAPSAAASPGP